MTVYPASDQKQIYSPYGYVLPERAYRVYTDAGATTPATIYADAGGVQGALIPNARIYSNQRGLIPSFHEISGAALYGKPDGFDGPIVRLVPDVSVIPTGPVDTTAFTRKSSLPVNVMDFGAKGDGTTNDTAAFTAALAAAGTGGVVYVPPVAHGYVCDALSIDNGQTLTGTGYYIDRDAVTTIGRAAGYNTAGNIKGSVIRSTVTNGLAVNIVKPTINVGGGLRDIAIVGPGSGTSTGIQMGRDTPSVRALLAPKLSNVLVANFSVGIAGYHVNEFVGDHILIKGCTKALSQVDDFNDATWTGLNIQRCTDTIVMESGGTVYSNRFLGLICQNNTNGPVIRGFSHVFVAPYFELTGAGANMMDFQGASNCLVIAPQKQGAGTYTINISGTANFNSFRELILSSTMLVVNAGSGTEFDGNLDNGARITGAGGNPYIRNRNDATTRIPTVITTSGSLPSLQGTNFEYRNGTSGPIRQWGTGSPEGVVTAPVGSEFRATDTGGVWVKISGTGNTGWRRIYSEVTGRATLVAGTVTVATAAATATANIFPASQVDGGTPGFLRVSTRVAGTSFTITSSSNTDTSTVAYRIIEP